MAEQNKNMMSYYHMVVIAVCMVAARLHLHFCGLGDMIRFRMSAQLYRMCHLVSDESRMEYLMAGRS